MKHSVNISPPNESEILSLVLEEIRGLRAEIKELKGGQKELKDENRNLKEVLQSIKTSTDFITGVYTTPKVDPAAKKKKLKTKKEEEKADLIKHLLKLK